MKNNNKPSVSADGKITEANPNQKLRLGLQNHARKFVSYLSSKNKLNNSDKQDIKIYRNYLSLSLSLSIFSKLRFAFIKLHIN